MRGTHLTIPGPTIERGRAGEGIMNAITKPAGQFAIRNLSVLAYAQGFTLWHYKAGKVLLESVAERGFFDMAKEMLAVGDMIAVSSAAGGRLLFVAATDDGVATEPLQ